MGVQWSGAPAAVMELEVIRQQDEPLTAGR